MSKDINLRLKAKALNLQAEDYETGKIKEESTEYTGQTIIDDVDPEIIQELYKNNETPNIEILGDKKVNNGFYILKHAKNSILCFFNPVKQVIERVEKQYVYGIKPKNAEQTFALHALLNDKLRIHIQRSHLLPSSYPTVITLNMQ